MAVLVPALAFLLVLFGGGALFVLAIMLAGRGR